MNDKAKTKKELVLEVQELRSRLTEAEETLRAIRNGEVDALVVLTPEGERVFTLEGADYPYRLLIEQMNEGAFTMAMDGTILYCNTRFAEIVKKPFEQVIHSSFYQFILPEDQWAIDAAVREERGEKGRWEIHLRAEDRSAVPVYLSVNFIEMDHVRSICAVVTDLTEQKRYEELLKSAKLAQSILDQSTEAILICDEKGSIMHASQEAFHQFPGELLYQSFDSVCPLSMGSSSPLQPKHFSISSVLSGETIRSVEVTHARGDAPESCFLLSAKPLALNGTEILGCVLSLTDITERRRAEQELERLRVEAENERRRLEAVMEALPVGVALTDARGGSVTTNKAYEQLWGTPRPKVESVNDYQAYKAWWPETGKPVAPEEWASAVAVQRGQPVVGQLMEIERFDGSRASVINSGAPVFDANGKITGCAVAIQDISDLRKTEKALRESNARTETILDSISDGFMTLDNDLVLTYFNQAAENLLGRKQEDVLGRKLFDAFPEARGSVFEEKYSWAVKEKKTTAFEAYFGVAPYENWYDVRVYPHEYGISAYFRVITEEKNAAEAVRKSKERFELLAETASRLLATSNPQGVVNELCQKVMTHLDCHAFFNYIVDPTKQRLHLNTCAGIPEQTAKDIEWLDYGVAVCGCAARDASRIVCENIPVTPDPRTELVKSFGIKAYACHPLFSEGRVMGTLSFGTRTRTAYTEDELSLMKTVADQVATAMERIRLLREVENSRDELEERVLERTEQLNRVNASLKAERQLFYDVLETLPAYVLLLKPDYHVVFANHIFRERFGESKGRRCFEFLFERSEPCERCETYTVMKTMAPLEWEWTGPDGRNYFVHDFPFTDLDGSTLILEMGIDITARKRAEDALRDASLYTRNLIEASLDPLVTISTDGKIMDVNIATELITGISRGELIGTDFSSYFTEPMNAGEVYQRVFREGFVRDYPLAIRHKSGRVTDVLYNATIYRNEAGAVQGVFAAARDITERKRAEEELRTKEKQIRFFAFQCLTAQETERRRIAAELHDSIASSLAGVKFRIEKTGEDIKKGLADPESMKDLSSNVAQSLGEVRRIMADLRPSILDDLGILPALNWFCREYQKTYPQISVEKQIGISEDEIPDSLKIVIFRISQEAMSNIAKHSKASLIDLALQKAGERVELTIQDNGHGFKTDEIAKGFGLSTMRERAELSGGTFAVQSTKGKGTIIRASWPLAL